MNHRFNRAWRMSRVLFGCWLTAVGWCLAGTALAADGLAGHESLTQGVGSQVNNRALLRMGLYPPDLLMRYQQRLQIDDAQRQAIGDAVKAFQADVAQLQWTLQNEQQIFAEQLLAHPVDETATMAQASKVLRLETQFKTAHFKLLLAIKNSLTTEQVKQIEAMKQQRRQP